MDHKNFLIHKLLSSKSHALAGSVSELSLQIFRANFAQNLRHLDAGLARYLAFERMPTRERTATKFCGSRNYAGRVHATFVRAARRIFSGTLQFFRASSAQNLRDPDAGRFLFRI